MTNAYNIALSLLKDHGDKAQREVKRRIRLYTNAHNCASLQTWYEVEEALHEIQQKESIHENHVETAQAS